MVKLDVLRLINIESLYGQVDLVKKEYGLDLKLSEITKFALPSCVTEI